MANLKTFSSNATETTLTAALGVGVTTISVVSSTGFPAVPFYAVLEPALDAKREVVLVTAKTAITFTATRAQDGTTDVAHDSGVSIKIVPVAAHINDLHDRVDTSYRSGGTDVPIVDGGTGASDAGTARTNLGLGTIATQAANNVAITGGSVTGITDLAVADGGTGASDAATARSNLGAMAATATKTIRIARTWHVPGEVKVASGDTDFIMGYRVSLPAGQTATAVAVAHKINSGTSATYEVHRNGALLSGFTAAAGTTLTLVDPSNIALADGDRITLVITAVSGTPKNLEVTFYEEHTV